MNESINADRIQYVAIVGSILILVGIFELIRKKKLKEQYSLLWLCFGIFFLFFSIWRDGLDKFSRLIGIYYAPAALFLILIMGMFFILLHYSIIISELSEKNKNLVQDVGILKFQVNELSKELVRMQDHQKNSAQSRL